MVWMLAFTVPLLLSGVVYQLVGLARDARRVPPPGRLVDVGDGKRLHVHSLGSTGPTVVFDAGIAASSLSWARVQPHVAKFARTCSYDRAGLAWSDSGCARVTAASCADDLHRLLSATGLPAPYVLVGHSFGTFVVRAYANLHPDLVAGLVLVDPIYPSEWLEMTREQRWRLRGGVFFSRLGSVLASLGLVRGCLSLLSRGSTGVPKRASRMFGSEAARVLDRLVGEVQKLPADLWPAVQAHWSQAKCFTSMARHLGGLRASAREIAVCHHASDIPMIVITAASQPDGGQREHARLAAQASHGRQVIAKGSGHWVHLDEPDLVIDAIREVTRSTTRRSA